MLSTQEKARFLKNLPAFKVLNATQIEILADLSEALAFQSGSQIFGQGDLGNSVYLVIDGEVALAREMDAKADPIRLATITPGQSFGELSLFSQIPRPFTATAEEDTVLLKILRDVFSAFASQYPDLIVEINRTLCQRLVEAYEQFSEIAQSYALNTLFEF